MSSSNCARRSNSYHELVVDCARFAEGILSEQQVRKRWHFDDATWAQLGEDDALVEAVELEKIRRVRNGAVAREKAQNAFIKAPEVLDGILHSDGVSPRHKIEAARELRATANVGPDAAPAEDRVIIHIDLGEDHKLVIDKQIKPTTNDKEVIDITPLAAIAANRRTEDGNGNPV